MALEHEIQKTILGYKDGVESLAEELGRGVSTIYAWGNVNSENNVPARMLLPLMQKTKDYRILRFLAKKTGHVLIKLNKQLKRNTDISTISDLQKVFLDCTQVLLKGCSGGVTKRECINALYDVVEAAQVMIRAIENDGYIAKDRSQLCLPIEEQ